jgi:signal transduction histidine kinase
MRTHMQLGAPVRLLALFVVISGVPLVALGWLGWRVLQQNHALETQRLREQLDSTASLLAGELNRGFSQWEDLLTHPDRWNRIVLPSDSVFLLIGPDGVVQQEGVPLAYYPHVPDSSVSPTAVFAAAEALEFRAENFPEAIAAYRRLASSTDRSIRANALMRLARGLRKQQHVREALAAYEEMAAFGDAVVAGSPAELVARRERAVLLDSMHDPVAAARERALLARALVEGRFRIDRPTFDFFRRFGSSSDIAPKEALSTPFRAAQAVEALQALWQEQAVGRGAWTGDAATFATVWRRTPRGTASITAPLEALTPGVLAAMRNLHVAVALDDRAGRRAWGQVSDGASVTKSANETGLPWMLHVASADPTTASAVMNSRRNLFAAGFGLVALVIASAAYVVFRAVNRELRVARLQSDFVAAVSHEFRTPLTAMCHLTEMLEEGGATPARLPQYYRALGKESRRLQALVENLLDFGRMDSGRRTYEFSETDAGDLVDHVVQEFADRSPSAARRLAKATLVDQAHERLTIHADREALALALRNVVDNAIKYSPESSPVRVAVTSRNGSVAVSVEDQGAGISSDERREVFRKFARGAASRSLNVKGTGIGLTMADQIVKAHGGRLELESAPGRGSTFTIILPVIGR